MLVNNIVAVGIAANKYCYLISGDVCSERNFEITDVNLIVLHESESGMALKMDVIIKPLDVDRRLSKTVAALAELSIRSDEEQESEI